MESGLMTRRLTEEAAYPSGDIIGRPPVPILLNAGDAVMDDEPFKGAAPNPLGLIFAVDRGEGR